MVWVVIVDQRIVAIYKERSRAKSLADNLFGTIEDWEVRGT